MRSNQTSTHAPRFFTPEALKRIGRLDLRAKYVVEGLMSGMHKSPFFGHSLEFLQHREYVPGDDLRRIDWKVWGKQDRFYVKQYEDETNLNATLLVDASESMLYGQHRAGMSKYEYACTLAITLAYILLRQQDAVGLIRFDEEIGSIAPQRTGRSQLNTLIQALDIEKPRAKTEIESTLMKAAEVFPRRGMVLIFSDLFAPREGLWKGLKRLRSCGHDVILFHVLDDDELEFTFSGPTQFEGLEVPQKLRCNPRALRDGYLEALHAFLDEVRIGCAANQVDYTLVRTTDAFDLTLSRMLLKRN